MEKKVDAMTLNEKLKAIRGRLSLVKDAVNPHFGNEYVSLNGVLAELNPLLDEYNLHMSQAPGVFESNLVIVTEIVNLDDETEYTSWRWPVPLHENPQKMASGSSYARRYSLLCGFATAAEDDDAEHSLGRGAGKHTPKGIQAALKRVGR